MDPRNNDRRYFLLAARIIGEFGAIIAAPVVVLALVGMKLDARFGTRPDFLISGFVLAAVITGVSIYRKAKQFGKEYQDIEGDGKKKL
ncbi:MAG: AtpZ/AtpI family protein [Patescibacteria group bacterium]